MDKILIIDDERMVLDTLGLALSTLPFEIISSDDPIDGLRIFADQKPFLVLLDINMPKMSGLDVIKHLIKHEVPRRRLAFPNPDDNLTDETELTLKDADFFVIVLTGFGCRELMQQCSNLGVDYFLNKPIHLLALRNVIETTHRLKVNRDEFMKAAGERVVG